MSCQPGCSVCERLRAAALALVGNGGIEGVTLEALSERAGCSREEDWSIQKAGSYTLHATATGAPTDAASNSFVIAPGAASTFVVAGFPPSTTAGDDSMNRFVVPVQSAEQVLGAPVHPNTPAASKA